MTFRDDQSDQLLSAYLDDELSPEERARVEQLLSDSESHRQLYEELVALRTGFNSLPHVRPSANFTQRVMLEAQRRMAAQQGQPFPAEENGRDSRKVIPLGAGRIQARSIWVAIAAAAALVLVVAGIQFLVGLRNDGHLADDGRLAGNDLPGTDHTEDGPGLLTEWPVQGDGKTRPADPRNIRREYFLVYDLAITPQGFDNKTFDALLVRHRIATDDAIDIDPRLQQELLKSRFLKGVRTAEKKEEPAKGQRRTELVYVVASAGKLNDLWQDLANHPNSIAGYQFDLAFTERDVNMLTRIDRAGRKQTERSNPPAEQLISAVGRAQRLVFTVALYNTSAREYRKFSRGPAQLRMPGNPAGNPVGPDKFGRDEISRALFVLRAHQPEKAPEDGR